MQRNCYARARCLFERAASVGASTDVPAARYSRCSTQSAASLTHGGCCRRALKAAERALAARQLAGGQEPVHDAEFRHAGMIGDLQWLQRCVRMGADAASADADGYTAMHMAAASGTHDILSELAEMGTPVSSRDVALRTPLHLAAQMAQLQCAQKLVELRCEAGADVAVCHSSVVCRADLEASDLHGFTPLQCARDVPAPLVAQLLEKEGARGTNHPSHPATLPPYYPATLPPYYPAAHLLHSLPGNSGPKLNPAADRPLRLLLSGSSGPALDKAVCVVHEGRRC